MVAVGDEVTEGESLAAEVALDTGVALETGVALDTGVGSRVPRPGEAEGTGAAGSPAISAAAVVAHIDAATTAATQVSATVRRVEPLAMSGIPDRFLCAYESDASCDLEVP